MGFALRTKWQSKSCGRASPPMQPRCQGWFTLHGACFKEDGIDTAPPPPARDPVSGDHTLTFGRYIPLCNSRQAPMTLSLSAFSCPCRSVRPGPVQETPKPPSRLFIWWLRWVLAHFSLSTALFSFLVGADAVGAVLHCCVGKKKSPLRSSTLASKSTMNKLRRRTPCCNAGPSWLQERCSVGDHISRCVTVTGFPVAGQMWEHFSLLES